MTLNKISKTMVNGLEEDLGRIEGKTTTVDQKIDTEIGKVTTQLAQKADENEVIKKGDGTLNDFDEPTRAVLQGLEPGQINAVLGYKNVQIENAAFIKESTNLYNENTNSKGFSISPSTGQLVANTGYNTSDFIPIKEQIDYYFLGVIAVAFYANDQQFLVRNDLPYSGRSLKSPSGSAFMRVHYQPSAQTQHPIRQVNKGTVLLPYESFHKPKLSDAIEVEVASYDDSAIQQSLTALNTDVTNIKNNGTVPLNGSVTEEKTTFIEKSTNLLNLETRSEGFSFDNTTGQPVANASYVISDFIEYVPNTALISSGVAKIGWYGENKAYLSRIDAPLSSHKWTPHATAKFYRVVVPKTHLNTAYINKGDTLLGYEPYYVRLTSKITANVNPQLVKDLVPDAIPTIVKTSKAILVGNNKVNFDFANKRIVFTDVRLNWEKNNLLLNQTVDISTTYATTSSKNQQYVLYYDTADSTVKYLNTLASNKPPSTAVILGMFRPLDKSVWNMDFYKINGEEIRKYKHPIDTNLDRVFTRNVTLPSNSFINSSKSADVYALYDALVEKFPDYITKTLMGYESSPSAIPMYLYDFNPSRPRSNVTLKQAKVIITSGTHNEKTGAWTLYEVMNNICNNWQEDELLEALRFNFRFLIAPIASPWAYDNNSRVNFNGVDMARNFPSGWVQGTYVPAPDLASTYGGTAPLSEVEAQFINHLMLDNLDALAVIDFHNFFSSTTTFIWCACKDAKTRDISMAHIQKMTRKWKKDFPAYASAIGDFVGHTNGDAPGGSLGVQAVEYGIDGGLTYEVCNRFYPNANSTANDSDALTFAYEAFVNFLCKYTHELLRMR